MPRRGRRTRAGWSIPAAPGVVVRVGDEAVAPSRITWEGMVMGRQDGAAGRVETRYRRLRTADSSPQSVSLVVLQETGIELKQHLIVEMTPQSTPRDICVPRVT